MRYASVLTALLATILASTQAHGQFVPDNLTVELNKTQIIRLPASASAVLIGNPDIADVTVHSVNTLFVVGRGYGETNLIVLGANGHEIMDTELKVVGTLPSDGVRLYNAKQRETYSCLPYCQPSPILGDAPGFIGSNSNTEAALVTSTAASSIAPSAPSQGPNDGGELTGGFNDNQGGANVNQGQPDGFGSGF